jgi:hypothetical protein
MLTTGRFAAYAVASAALTYVVVMSALSTHLSLYSFLVYITTHKLSALVLTNMAVVIVASCVMVIKQIFLGKLKPAEVEVSDTEICCARGHSAQ